MQFGSRLRQLRKQAGFTQKELAERMDVSPSYINKVERERLHFGDYPSAKFIHRLADELNADEDELLLLADKVPEAIQKRIREKPDEFRILANVDDDTLFQVVEGIKNNATSRRRNV